MGYSTPQELITAARDSVFSIYDLIPPNSEARGGEPQVRRHVRDFLAAFERLAPSRAGFAG